MTKETKTMQVDNLTLINEWGAAEERRRELEAEHRRVTEALSYATKQVADLSGQLLERGYRLSGRVNAGR